MYGAGIQDPGWGGMFKGDPLGVTRVLWASLLLAAYLILVLLFFLEAEWGTPGGLPLVGAIGLGLLSITNALLVRGLIPLRGEGPEAVAMAYRTRFFLGFALAEAPLLLAFVMTFVIEEKWPYVVVLPAFTIAMLLMAPSPSNIATEQQKLNHRGANVNLLAALMGSLPPEGDHTERST